MGIVILVLLFFLFKKKLPTGSSSSTNQAEQQSPGETPGVGSGQNIPPPPAVVVPPHEYTPEEQTVRQTSRIFVERFASYSNQNDNAHLEDAALLATARMQSWLETQKLEMSRDYEGVTTEVLQMSITRLEATRATVSINTQQTLFTRTDGELKKTIVQKKGRVELVKQGDSWKVDGFFWDK